jgi:hypothetical protein
LENINNLKVVTEVDNYNCCGSLQILVKKRIILLNR